MAGPRPDDSYNPTQSVSPNLSAPNDYLSVRANPNQMGAQVGQSIAGLGKTGEQVGSEQMKIELQKQGLANEHAATMAELQLATDGGEVYNKYRSLEGLDASNSKPQAIQDYLAVNQKIRASLGNQAAQRAYDQLATRRMSFVIQDMNSYAAEQQKHAYRQGNKDLTALAVDQAGTYNVATDPKQLQFQEGTIVHSVNTAFTAPGYGLYQSIPVKQGPDGRLQFNTETDQGKIAQAQYDTEVNTHIGQMYSNAIKIMATNPDPKNPGSVDRAVNFMIENKDKIPAKTYATLSAELSGPYRNNQTRLIAQDTEDEWTNKYNESLSSGSTGPSYATNLGNVTIHGGAFANPTTPVDGVILAANNLKDPRYNGKTIAEASKTWTSTDQAAWLKNVSTGSGLSPDTVIDASNPVQVKQLLRGISLAEKSPEDRKAFSEDVLSRGVEAAFKGSQASLSPGLVPTLQGGLHQSRADYFGDHEAEILDSVRQKASQNGYDTIGQDMAVERTKSRIAEIRSVQNNEVHSLTNQVLAKVMDEKHPITNMSYLDNSSDPSLRDTWTKLQGLDYYKAMGIQRIVEAQARGHSKTYGTDFYNHLNEVLTGKVTDMSQLQNYFGGDEAPISNTGVRALSQITGDMATPQGQGFAAGLSTFLNNARGQITGSSVFPGVNPEVLAPKFNKYLMQVLPQIEAKRADMLQKNEDPMTMFNPDSKDYIGKGIVAPSKGEIDKAVFSTAFSNPGALGVSGPPPPPPPPASKQLTFNSLEDVGRAYSENKITKEEARDIVSKKFGGFAPKVPGPQ